MSSVGEREAAIAQMAASDEATAALRQHLQDIVEGAAFKGSHRSAQFLAYIVEQAIAGNFDSLKERMIGIELFGRSPTYDTSEDAIVRVTASDVRKRLLQHYGRHGTASEFRISLPLGSYIPEITRSSPDGTAETGKVTFEVGRSVQNAPVPPTARAATPKVCETGPAISALENSGTPVTLLPVTSQPRAQRRWLLAMATLAVINLALWALVWRHSNAAAKSQPMAEAPWSAFFTSSRPTHLITSDPDIEGIQILSGAPISVSDYANRHYLPHPGALPPVVEKICTDILHGDKSSTADAAIAADIAALARSYSRKLDVIGARDLQFSNLRTDDNFIFLGSPLSNPWVATFAPQLDFGFVPASYGNQKFSGTEVIRNFHPRAGEPAHYVPTAQGGGTGESFAIVALVGNADQKGEVLLLAGADREGTLAAGELVTDLSRLAAALQRCGLSASSPIRHFELLLRVDTMANYPTQSTVAVCHLLPGPTAR